METPDEVDALRRAVPGAAIVVCRLLASAMVRETRLQAREHGASRDWHLARLESRVSDHRPLLVDVTYSAERPDLLR